MAAWSELGSGARAGIVAVGAATVALLGYVYWARPAPDVPVAVIAPTDHPVVAPDAPLLAVTADQPALATPEATGAQDVAQEDVTPNDVSDKDVLAATETSLLTPIEPVTQTVAPLAPAFDNWRVDANGASVVAGRAEPGAVVTVLVDAVAVAETTASARGEFVALFTLSPNPNPSLMTLVALLGDGTSLISSQSVALAAIAGPVMVALADPVAEGAPQAASDLPPTPELAPAPELAPQPDAAPQPEVAQAPAPDALPEVGQAPAAVLITDEGARVLQTESAASVPVSLDAIAYSSLGDVQLSGSGQAGAAIRIYLENALTASASVDATGHWSFTLTDTPPGLYTLRVDQLDGAGTVTARFETPFKRETREALAALVAPSETVSSPTAVRAPEVAKDVSEAIGEQPAEPVADVPPELVATGPAKARATMPTPTTSDIVPEEAAQTAAVTAPSQPDVTPPMQAPGQIEASLAAPATADLTAPAVSASALGEPNAEPTAPSPVPSVSITVQPGYTLWGIARRQLGQGVLYVQVFEANKDSIKNPDLIYPGQVFVLPTR